jgi:hypothetical protein
MATAAKAPTNGLLVPEDFGGNVGLLVPGPLAGDRVGVVASPCVAFASTGDEIVGAVTGAVDSFGAIVSLSDIVAGGIVALDEAVGARLPLVVGAKLEVGRKLKLKPLLVGAGLIVVKFTMGVGIAVMPSPGDGLGVENKSAGTSPGTNSQVSEQPTAVMHSHRNGTKILVAFSSSVNANSVPPHTEGSAQSSDRFNSAQGSPEAPSIGQTK